MPQINTIVLVGHCPPDTASLRHAASRVPGIDAVQTANTDAELETVADSSSLLLINRVLDGRFSVDHGVDLIQPLLSRDNPPKVMLISDYPDAQAAAEAAGALPGFGKSTTHSPTTAELLASTVNGVEAE